MSELSAIEAELQALRARRASVLRERQRKLAPPPPPAAPAEPEINPYEVHERHWRYACERLAEREQGKWRPFASAWKAAGIVT
jgi:hypothetical protein